MDSVLLFLSRLFGRSHNLRIADARESLGYWSRRADDLPWHRRAARREARERATAARAQLLGAHLEHSRLGTLAPRVTPLLDVRARTVGALAFTTIRRTPIGRKLMLGAAVAGACALAFIATATFVATQLLF
jgi:hypothetical protein